MDEPMRRVLGIFSDMKSNQLDLHNLLEAGGNDPAARNEAVDAVARLVREGYLEGRGSDFYALTEKGRQETMNDER